MWNLFDVVLRKCDEIFSLVKAWESWTLEEPAETELEKKQAELNVNSVDGDASTPLPTSRLILLTHFYTSNPIKIHFNQEGSDGGKIISDM